MAMPSDPRCVLVLGGRGFIGRHTVEALVAMGARVRIGTRYPGPAEATAVADPCPLLGTRFETLLRPADWLPRLAGVDVVVNCVGILRRRGVETYDRVHHQAPAALAAACRDLAIPFVHVSALGLDGECRSGFLKSKQAGEAALRASGVRGCLVRPSLLDAPCGGYGAKWIRRVARWPLLALPADAVGRIAALDVRDLGEALAVLALMPPGPGLAEYELGGSEAEPLRDHIARLRRGYGRPPARVLAIPGWLARTGAHLCDLVHATPFSFGHWELLCRDNCPRSNDLPALLGRPPRVIGAGEREPGRNAPAPLPA